MKRDFSAMLMLCFVIAWACLSRFKGIASTSTLEQCKFTLLFEVLAGSLDKDYQLFNTLLYEADKSYIAVSLDGFIAPPDKELDWIPQEVKFLLNKEYEMADNLLMGANTYLYLFKHWGGWPYKSQRSLWCPTTTIMLPEITM